MIALYRLLNRVAGITQKLQGRTTDVIDANQNVNTCIEDIQLLRENVDQESDVISKHAVRMTDQLNVEPNIPIVAKKQFIEKMYQLIRLKSTINELLSYQLLTHSFQK